MKHRLKIVDFETGVVTSTFQEDESNRDRQFCEHHLMEARETGAPQHLPVRQGDTLDVEDGSELFSPSEFLAEFATELGRPFEQYRNEYSFRLLREWRGAAAFEICQAEAPDSRRADDHVEQALHICLVVWTEPGGRAAAPWWHDEHIRPITERSSTFASPISTTLGYEGMTSWISRNSADVSSAVLPFVLVIEPTMYWNALLFNNKKKSWLNRMTRCFAWSLIGNNAIWETFALPDGSNYEGQHLNGKPHGWGRLNWSDGRRYEGGFRNGKRHGRGCFSLANGDHYDGPWRHGEEYGRGVIVQDGTRYRYQTSFLRWLRQYLRSRLLGLSMTAYKRLMIGALCVALLIALGFSFVDGMREYRYYEDTKREWESWIAVCDLPPRFATSLPGELAHFAYPENILIDFDGTWEAIHVEKPGPITRVEYLSHLFRRAADYLGANDRRMAVPTVVIDACAQDVDLAMGEWHRQFDQLNDAILDANDGELRRAVDAIEKQLAD